MKKILAIAAVMSLCVTSTAFANHHEGKADEMWEKCDANKDGFISKEEFMNSKAEHFTKADKNSDGKISKDEHKEMVEKWKDKTDD